MAFISKFELLDLKANARHTETFGGYSVRGQDGEKFIQINAIGSVDREMPGKVSQTPRLTITAIEQLADLKKNHF